MLEVTQADRELFITLSNADGQMAERILCGQAFTWEVEQIARHRLAERERAFADGFSAALQGAEAVIWAIEDDAFLYPTVSDALQEVIAELQEMEGNWTKRSSVAHRHAVQEEARLAEREAVVKWLNNAARWLNDGECCGQKCSDGVCAAPACIWGDELKLLHSVADAIEAGEHRK